MAESMIIKIKEKTIKERGSVYEAVRRCWVANKERAEQAEYVLAVVNGRVERVFEPEEWYFPKAEFCKKTACSEGETCGRIAFYGKEASIQKEYLDKDIPAKGGQNPIRYINISDIKKTKEREINMIDEKIIIKALRSANDKNYKSFKIKEYYSALIEGSSDEGRIALARARLLSIEKELMNWNKKQSKKTHFTMFNNESSIMSPEESALILIKYLREKGLLND